MKSPFVPPRRLPALLSGKHRAPLHWGDWTIWSSAFHDQMLQALEISVRAPHHAHYYVEECEALLSSFLSVRNVVLVNSATSGLMLALRALGLKPGDEVCVPAYTFVAPAHAVIHVGGIPSFVDIDEQSFCMSPYSLEAAIGPNTRGVIVVHIGGKPADMNSLLSIANARGIWVIEDAAQAFGAKVGERSVGCLGHIGIFSFGSKLISCQRGGAIVTSDDSLASICRSLRYHGIRKTGMGMHHLDPGYNCTLAPLLAKMISIQLGFCRDLITQRSSIIRRIVSLIESHPLIRIAKPVPDTTSVNYMIEAVLTDAAPPALTRQRVIDAFRAEGVPASDFGLAPHPIYNNPSLSTFAAAPCPVAESVYRTLFFLCHFKDFPLINCAPSIADEVARRTLVVLEFANEIASMVPNCNGPP